MTVSVPVKGSAVRQVAAGALRLPLDSVAWPRDCHRRARPSPTRSGLPVLGALSPVARIFLLGTLVVSAIAVVLDFGLHADATVVFIASGVAILGLAWVVGL